MRINILQGAFLPVPAIRGGAIEKAWHALGRSFAANGHQVTHVSRLCDGLERAESMDGVRHVRVPGTDAVKNPYLLKALELPYVLRARRVLSVADILVNHTFWGPLLLPRQKYGRIYVHLGRYPKGQLRLYGKASRLQAPSTAIADAARVELPDGKSRVTTLPYPLSGRTCDAKPIEERKKRVLYAGRIHPEKGILELVQAWRTLPQECKNGWKLRIVGPWREEQGGGGARFRDEIIKKADSSIEIHEPIFDDGLLRKEYEKARIFAYPSLAVRGETFGLAVLEAMSAGCVPLVSSLPCFEDFVEEDRNGFFFDLDETPIENGVSLGLNKVLSCKNLHALSMAAKMTTRSYELEPVAARYIEDFEQTIR